MLKHYSLIFSPRKGGENHQKAMKEVLGNLLVVTKFRALLPETWNILLKLMIGITDQLFEVSSNPNEDPQSSFLSLASQSLKVSCDG